MVLTLPSGWLPVLKAELDESYWPDLEAFVAAERAEHTIYPPAAEVFAALEATSFEQVKVVLLGQDPYHGEGQAHGMCFSVRPGVTPPPSLRNMFNELRDDLGCPVPRDGYLLPWAQQGVLLLNTVLTVRAHEAHSHKGRGWERFTDAVIRAVNTREDPVVFVLWGNHAKKKKPLIDAARHTIVEGAHPSPLSARLFRGSRPYSQVNAALTAAGKAPVDWCLPG